MLKASLEETEGRFPTHATPVHQRLFENKALALKTRLSTIQVQAFNACPRYPSLWRNDGLS